MAVTEYVDIEDLDETYDDDDDSHPSLTQVKKYVKSANRFLNGKIGPDQSDLDGNIREAGILLTEIKIHNKKVKDNVPGYQYYKRFEMNEPIYELLKNVLMGQYGSFTHDPTTSAL